MRPLLSQRTIAGAATAMVLGLTMSPGCLSRPTANPHVLVVAITNERLDALLDPATASLDDRERRALYSEAQRILAEEVPYVSLWYKTNFIIARRNLSGLRLTPPADYAFLRQVGRTEARASN